MKHFSPLCFLFLGLLPSCSEEEKKNPPIINKVQPSKAAVGDIVEISGSFLGSASRVSFRLGGVSVLADIRSKSEIMLQVQVPEIAPGKVDIEVESPDGKSGSLSFEVLRPSMQISSIAPSQGRPGATVTIAGLNLDLVQEVRFSDGNSSKANFTSNSNGLSVIVPADAKTGSICLIHAGGKTCSATIFNVVADPVIISLSSSKGVEGNVIEIKGEHLANAKVNFGATQAKISENTSGLIKVAVPKFSQVSELQLTVQTAGGTISRNFTVAPASEIKTAIPNGLIPGSALTLKGAGFYEIQSIRLPGGKVVSKSELIRNEENDITFKVPAGVSSGEVKLVSQYGEGKAQSLSLITGGTGLNADNIANNTTNVGSIGAVSNLCRPVVFKDCYIAYYPNKSTTPPRIEGFTWEGIYSSRLYSLCYCNKPGCPDVYGSCDLCFDQNEKNFYYGDFSKFGSTTYRHLSFDGDFFPCRISDLDWRDIGGGYYQPRCTSNANAAFPYSFSINLELSKKGNFIENDIYTGFMVVDFFDRNNYNKVNTFYGNQVKTGEYELYSVINPSDRLVIKLDNF